jgi:transcription initiation factor TFIIB
VARTFREIFNLTRVSKKEIGRVFKLLEKFLVDIQNEGDKTGHSAVSTVNNFESRPSTNAEDLVRRYVSQLGVRNQSEVESVGMLIAKKTGQVSTLAGRSPLSVAAACIFMATHYLGEAKTSKDIALVAGVSDGTIKTAYKYLYAEKESLLDAEALQKSRGRGKIERLPSA